MREFTEKISGLYTLNLRLKALSDNIRDKHPELQNRLPRFRWLPELLAFGRLTVFFIENGSEVLTDKSRAVRAMMQADRDEWDRAQSTINRPYIPWRNPLEVAEERECRLQWEMLSEKTRAKTKLSDMLDQLREDRERRRKAFREERETRFDAQRQEQPAARLLSMVRHTD